MDKADKFTKKELAKIQPWEPTDHAPGSEGKILVLAARYEIGAFPIWNPGDRIGFENLVEDSVDEESDDDDWEL